jgi:uncharacterized protein YrrD
MIRLTKKGNLKKMLFLSSDITNKTIFSLESGEDVADITGIIINPANLKIEAFYIKSPFISYKAVVFTDDIRESNIGGFVIDGMKNLVPMDDNLIRLQGIINLNFKIDELNVHDTEGKKIGKIREYVFNDSAFKIVRIHVTEKSLKSKILDKIILIKRSQIVKLSNKRMIVNV